MREIKFRAFFKKYNPLVENKNGEMCEVRNIDFSDKTAYLKTYSGYHIGYHEFAEFELMQFTGLKDCNGKEIYEGDILQSIDGGVIKEVRFNAFHAMFETVILKSVEEYWIGSVSILSKYVCDNYHVIGNIFENLELLK